MFETPTFDDFVAQLRMQRERAIREFALETDRIKAAMATRGALRSSMTVTQMLDAMDRAVAEGTAALLGELRRAATATALEKGQLRKLTQGELAGLFDEVVEAASWTRVRDWVRSTAIDKLIAERIENLREQQKFWIRQSDIGFHVKAEPEALVATTNVLNATTVIGGIQQGTSGSHQVITVALDFARIADALRDVERELAKADIADPAFDELSGDLSTIKAQLSKPQPNPTILQETGKSIRNVAEGVLGGILTSPALAALSNLSSALTL